MKYLLLVSISLLLFTGLVIGFSSSTVPVEQQSACNGTSIGEASAQVFVEENEVGVDGIYCASTGGYHVVEENLTEESGVINASIVIEGPEEDEMVTQVITPVKFSVSDEFENGSYDVNYSVSVEETELESGSETIEVDNIQVEDSEENDTRFMESLRRWFSGLF